MSSNVAKFCKKHGEIMFDNFVSIDKLVIRVRDYCFAWPQFEEDCAATQEGLIVAVEFSREQPTELFHKLGFATCPLHEWLRDG